jgi:hypothetical protein
LTAGLFTQMVEDVAEAMFFDKSIKVFFKLDLQWNQMILTSNLGFFWFSLLFY